MFVMCLMDAVIYTQRWLTQNWIEIPLHAHIYFCVVFFFYLRFSISDSLLCFFNILWSSKRFWGGRRTVGILSWAQKKNRYRISFLLSRSMCLEGLLSHDGRGGSVWGESILPGCQRRGQDGHELWSLKFLPFLPQIFHGKTWIFRKPFDVKHLQWLIDLIEFCRFLTWIYLTWGANTQSIAGRLKVIKEFFWNQICVLSCNSFASLPFSWLRVKKCSCVFCGRRNLSVLGEKIW